MCHIPTRRDFLKAGTAAICAAHGAPCLGAPGRAPVVWQPAKAPASPTKAEVVRCTGEEGVPGERLRHGRVSYVSRFLAHSRS